MIVKPFTLDKTKIKRIFVFGCSFTNFIWPTWANLLAKEIPTADFYNFGISGLGNLGISCRISEAAYKFDFCETDLVAVMWTTFLREDRWFEGKWLGAGNVYNTGYYNKEFIQQYSDVSGYFIRDLSLINMTKNFLESSKCQALLMPSVPIDFLDHSWLAHNVEKQKEVISTYNKLFEEMPKSLFAHCKIHECWPVTHTYYWPEMKMNHNDSHPSPWHYFEYLDNNIVKLSEETKDYAMKVTERLKTLSNKSDIVKEFEYDAKSRFLF